MSTESGHMSKIKIYEKQRRDHENEKLRLEGIIRSMEGQLKGPEVRDFLCYCKYSKYNRILIVLAPKLSYVLLTFVETSR